MRAKAKIPLPNNSLTGSMPAIATNPKYKVRNVLRPAEAAEVLEIQFLNFMNPTSASMIRHSWVVAI